MRTLLIICAIVLVSTAAFGQTLVDVPMNQQINIGAGDAITATVPLSFEPAAPPTESEDFARLSLADGYYFSYIDLNLAGVGTIDISQPGLAFDIDCRYYQNADTNTNSTLDAPIFLRFYSGSGVRNYGIFYALQNGDEPYPTWAHKTVDLGTWSNESSFDPTNVDRICLWGTDWGGAGDDFVDLKNVKIAAVPEPGGMLALLTGLIGLAPLMRRRR